MIASTTSSSSFFFSLFSSLIHLQVLCLAGTLLTLLICLQSACTLAHTGLFIVRHSDWLSLSFSVYPLLFFFYSLSSIHPLSASWDDHSSTSFFFLFPLFLSSLLSFHCFISPNRFAVGFTVKGKSRHNRKEISENKTIQGQHELSLFFHSDKYLDTFFRFSHSLTTTAYNTS